MVCCISSEYTTSYIGDTEAKMQTVRRSTICVIKLWQISRVYDYTVETITISQSVWTVV
jgi:hypothetical protein